MFWQMWWVAIPLAGIGAGVAKQWLALKGRQLDVACADEGLRLLQAQPSSRRRRARAGDDGQGVGLAAVEVESHNRLLGGRDLEAGSHLERVSARSREQLPEPPVPQACQLAEAIDREGGSVIGAIGAGVELEMGGDRYGRDRLRRRPGCRSRPRRRAPAGTGRDDEEESR